MPATGGTGEQVRAWRPELAGVAEVFHARFVQHRYPPHTHDTWTVLIVDQGAIRYGLDRREHDSGAGTVTVLPPGVVHDGRAADGHGFRKRVLYLEAGLVDPGLVGAAVDRPRLHVPTLYRAVSRLHGTLRDKDDILAGEAQLAAIVEGLEAELLQRPPERAPADPTVADQLRQLLDAHVTETITLAQAGAVIGAHPTHLVRSFTEAFGIPPHAYVIGRRIDEGRRRLLAGQPGARVAGDLGFHDQAHFSRHFRRHVGISPGRFMRGFGPQDP